MEVFVDDETKLTLHGLQQYYVKLKDSEKNRKLFDLLDVLEFNQVSKSGGLLLFAHACSSAGTLYAQRSWASRFWRIMHMLSGLVLSHTELRTSTG